MLKLDVKGIGSSIWILSVCLGFVACSPLKEGKDQGGIEARSGHWIKINPAHDTWFKKTKADSTELDQIGKDKCLLNHGAVYEIQEAPAKDGKHYSINLRRETPGCAFSQGFVFISHVSDDSVQSINRSARTQAAEEQQSVPAGQYPWIVVGEEDTFIKSAAAPLASLNYGTGKCRLFGGLRYNLQASPVVVGGHYQLNLRKIIPGCGFSSGFVEVATISRTSDDAAAVNESPAASSGLTKRERAFLDTIAYAEGTDDSYNISFSYAQFGSFKDHPRRIYCSSGYCSDAAGRYQFLSTTWDSVRRDLNLRDFSPKSQDLGALYLIKARGVKDVSSLQTYSQFANAIYLCNTEWASLPGSPYGQPRVPMQTLWVKYQKFLID